MATRQRNVSHNLSSPTNAPAIFAREAEAKKHRLRKDDLKDAMSRLFAADKISSSHTADRETLPTNISIKALLTDHMGLCFRETYATDAFAFILEPHAARWMRTGTDLYDGVPLSSS